MRGLLRSTPELRWLVARGGPLVLRERALFAGASAVVLGMASRLAAAELTAAEVLQRTGTDDVSWSTTVDAGAAGMAEAPAWMIGPEEPFERCIVSDGGSEPARFAPPAWRLLGAVLGPALSLAGLIELARAAGQALDGGF